MEAVAKLRNNPTSTRKTRLVIDMIRGLEVNEALNILKFTKKESAPKIEKLLISAINNWGQKNEAAPEDSSLVVKSCWVDGGKMLKRFRPAPQGRAHRIRKRSNHITLVVDTKEVATKAAK
ncbi:MAG: 50S ribosomal protein L22 [Chitinophagales bacterium]|nr:50S ribosomal protein L22 [Bacteroidota bacterium]MCB0541067.1 50S ribosomal protein L22 [Bacteroidota bacterium]MCB9255928.1 50S ribosomal protein L22 [Chitinophagales bacterium]